MPLPLPERGERLFVLGGTGAGKSTLLTHVITTIAVSRPQSEHLILDSKPRFVPEVTPWFLPTPTWRREMLTFIPGSMQVRSWAECRRAAALGKRIWIAQVEDRDGSRWATEVAAMTWIVGDLFSDQTRPSNRHPKERWVWVDEGLDFWTPSAQSPKLHTPSLLRVIRAGREWGIGAGVASQRAMCIPIQALSEAQHIAMLRMDSETDLPRVGQAGVPKAVLERLVPDDDMVVGWWSRASRHDFRRFRLVRGGTQ
jgi:energy-coupling factor transporter ATP-binding protein EcfA2